MGENETDDVIWDSAKGPITHIMMPIAEIERLTSERDEFLGLLREVEWADGQGGCLFCWSHRLQGHVGDCRLAAALASKR